MTVMSTVENEAVVSQVYAQALQHRSEGRELPAHEQVVYEVELLCQEVNSGASFEQYFRWASLCEISRIVARLEALGLAQVAVLTREALQVAFPGGLPDTEQQLGELTDWSAGQLERLQALAARFSDHNGAITNALAAFYRMSRVRLGA